MRRLNVKPKLTPEERKAAQKAKEAEKKALVKGFKEMNAQAWELAQDASRIVLELYRDDYRKEAQELQVKANNFVRLVVNTQEFQKRYYQWALENPGLAMKQSLDLNTKVVKMEGDIQHKHFVMVNMEDPDSWRKKAIDVAIEPESTEKIPWEQE